MEEIYIYIFVQLQNMYVNIFKMPGKRKKFTCVHEKIRVSICKLVELFRSK